MFDCINIENMFFTVKILFLQTFNYKIFFKFKPDIQQKLFFCFVGYQLLNISNVSGLITQNFSIMHDENKIKTHSPA